jgi:glycerophosphoryl diester phosphodiesterase
VNGAAAVLVAAGLLTAWMSSPHGSGRPIVIAHRGASGERPEHTLEAYRVAIEAGADFVEPDLVATRDGVLVCRHENEISDTTDVARRPEFASRRATKSVDGSAGTGWFTEDLTLAELKTLRARERLPELRGTAFDGRFEVPSFEELLALVGSANARPARKDRPVGVYPETKHSSYFASLGLPLEDRLLEALRRHGLDRAFAPVFIQSFEVQNLKRLATLTRVPLVQLIDSRGSPWDASVAGSKLRYADMTRPEGLREIATYARAIGPDKSLVLPRDAAGRLLPSTRLVGDAHAVGLLVHVYTLRAENPFLPLEFRRPGGAAVRGDLAAEAAAFLEAGVDGFFADQPELGVRARDAFLRR